MVFSESDILPTLFLVFPLLVCHLPFACISRALRDARCFRRAFFTYTSRKHSPVFLLFFSIICTTIINLCCCKRRTFFERCVPNCNSTNNMAPANNSTDCSGGARSKTKSSKPTTDPAPAAASSSDAAELPSGWQMRFSNSRQLPYYVNMHSRESFWERPTKVASRTSVHESLPKASLHSVQSRSREYRMR